VVRIGPHDNPQPAGRGRARFFVGSWCYWPAIYVGAHSPGRYFESKTAGSGNVAKSFFLADLFSSGAFGRAASAYKRRGQSATAVLTGEKRTGRGLAQGGDPLGRCESRMANVQGEGVQDGPTRTPRGAGFSIRLLLDQVRQLRFPVHVAIRYRLAESQTHGPHTAARPGGGGKTKKKKTRYGAVACGQRRLDCQGAPSHRLTGVPSRQPPAGGAHREDLVAQP